MNICGYARISVDDEQNKENVSIENQKAIIADYVSTHFPDAHLTFFEDRDRSGYTFEQREGYQQMRPKLFSGESQILIIKDFSRFSRRNSLGLLELETLRDAGVRFISINDGIDYPTNDDWTLIQIKFLMNEMPVTDTSKKIKAIIQHRQKNGEWVCAVPYGYRMINTKEMVYEVDPPAAEVVREIFALYNSGWGYKRIANYLTDKGIPTPRANEIAWKEAQGRQTRLKSKAEWSIISVSSILSNDFYIGTLRQGKYSRKKIHGKDVKKADEDHIVITNAHLAIIDARTFAYTQDQLQRRSRENYRGEKKYATDYSGFLFCGDCGSPMFSMSRPDLAPAYTCGTYHKRGRKGCSSHHIRVDRLDELLKRYVRRVRDNSSDLIEAIEAKIKAQPQREEEIGNSINNLEQQLAAAKEQLRNLYKRRVIDLSGKSEDTATIVAEAYNDLETELTNRISNLTKQIDNNIDLRNQLIESNRSAKTVLDVFSDILDKPKLNKQDIALIVDRIIVYEDHLDIQLKADVCGLISYNVDDLQKNIIDNIDTTTYNDTVVQQTAHHTDKVLGVNVINNGDPLEIYTSRDGEVIFKKYSLMGGLDDFAAQLCETMSRSTGAICAVTDRDSVIAVAGGAKRELLGKGITAQLEQVMENRRIYQYDGQGPQIPVSDSSDRLMAIVAAPILSEGDLLGLVLFISDSPAAAGDAEYKLAQTVAAFLGRHMEN